MTIVPHLESFIARFIAGLPAAIAVIVGGFVLSFLVRRLLKLLADKTSLEPRDVAPFQHVLNWVIVGTAIVLLLAAFGFPIGGLWNSITAALALVAVGFIAVWSVLSNWLCTIVILLTRPFAIGDEIEFAGEQVRGRVENLNFIYTTLRCEDGSLMQIPNNMFFQKVLKRRCAESSQVSLAQQLNGRGTAVS
ncbi:MAG TPA: mechanosensitive ion channel family protein [Opitutaceae bacterium]